MIDVSSIRRDKILTVLSFVIFIIGLFAFLLPILYTLSLSFRYQPDVLIFPPTLIPPRFTISAYPGMLTIIPVFKYIMNSAVVAAGTTIICISLASLAAYSFARLRFRFADQLMVLLLISQMFPGASIMVPLFQVLKKLLLYDTHQGLVFVYSGFAVPFCTWMLYGYFKTIPKELEEAALIDGCSRINSLIKIILPLALPGIAATSVFAMLSAWNEFTFALLFIQTKAKFLITPSLTLFIGQWKTDLSFLSAAAVTSSIPTLIAFILVRRYFVSGLVAGALKG